MSDKTILVVEDDRDIRETLEELLESEGYAVRSAVNGQQALDWLRAAPALPSLILLDVMMPVKDGPTFRREQVDDARLADVPVVIMSADAHIEEKQRTMRAAAIIRKPFDIDSLLRTVAQHAR